jgi:hypothetical protein
MILFPGANASDASGCSADDWDRYRFCVKVGAAHRRWCVRTWWSAAERFGNPGIAVQAWRADTELHNRRRQPTAGMRFLE